MGLPKALLRLSIYINIRICIRCLIRNINNSQVLGWPKTVAEHLLIIDRVSRCNSKQIRQGLATTPTTLRTTLFLLTDHYLRSSLTHQSWTHGSNKTPEIIMAFIFTCGTHMFSSLLQGFENITAQCQNCGNFSAKIYKRWYACLLERTKHAYLVC